MPCHLLQKNKQTMSKGKTKKNQFSFSLFLFFRLIFRGNCAPVYRASYLTRVFLTRKKERKKNQKTKNEGRKKQRERDKSSHNETEKMSPQDHTNYDYKISDYSQFFVDKLYIKWFIETNTTKLTQQNCVDDKMFFFNTTNFQLNLTKRPKLQSQTFGCFWCAQRQ